MIILICYKDDIFNKKQNNNDNNDKFQCSKKHKGRIYKNMSKVAYMHLQEYIFGIRHLKTSKAWIIINLIRTI